MGISCGIRRETDYHRYSSYRGVVRKTFENVVGRDFSAAAPWQKMGTDVTEFKQPWGKAYFAPVYDFGSKEIVAWATSTRPDMEQQELLLDRLLERMPEGARPILHSDMGWQYQHPRWTERLMLASIYFSPFSPMHFRQSRQRGYAGFANADVPLSAPRRPPPSRPHRRWTRPSGGTTGPLS